MPDNYEINEYLSNCTSDMSDGTNGEPSAPGSFSGDAGTQVGLPDYKYLERKRKQRPRVRALLHRRDPYGISKNPWDRKARELLMRESRLSREELAILRKQTHKRHVQRRRKTIESSEDNLIKQLGMPSVQLKNDSTCSDGNFYHVYADNTFLGCIYNLSWNSEDQPKTLIALSKEYPWYSWPADNALEAKRFRTKEDATNYLIALANSEEPPQDSFEWPD